MSPENTTPDPELAIRLKRKAGDEDDHLDSTSKKSHIYRPIAIPRGIRKTASVVILEQLSASDTSPTKVVGANDESVSTVCDQNDAFLGIGKPVKGAQVIDLTADDDESPLESAISESIAAGSITTKSTTADKIVTADVNSTLLSSLALTRSPNKLSTSRLATKRNAIGFDAPLVHPRPLHPTISRRPHLLRLANGHNTDGSKTSKATHSSRTNKPTIRADPILPQPNLPGAITSTTTPSPQSPTESDFSAWKRDHNIPTTPPPPSLPAQRNPHKPAPGPNNKKKARRPRPMTKQEREEWLTLDPRNQLFSKGYIPSPEIGSDEEGWDGRVGDDVDVDFLAPNGGLWR